MYLVSNSNIYSNQAQTREEIIEALSKNGNEVTLRKSRVNPNLEILLMDGHPVAKVFLTQGSQIDFLAKAGII